MAVTQGSSKAPAGDWVQEWHSGAPKQEGEVQATLAKVPDPT